MFVIIVLFLIAFVLMFGGLGFLINSLMNKKILSFSLGLILIALSYGVLISMFMATTPVTGDSTKEIVATNAYGKPMYDVVPDNESIISYKVSLKTGGTKTISPTVIHVNKSKQSYLKGVKKSKVVNLGFVKIPISEYTDYTLYLNDKR